MDDDASDLPSDEDDDDDDDEDDLLGRREDDDEDDDDEDDEEAEMEQAGAGAAVGQAGKDGAKPPLKAATQRSPAGKRGFKVQFQDDDQSDVPVTPLPRTTARFSARIVSLDCYMSPGVPEAEHPVLQAPHPIVRIFGPTPAGQKTCIHLHGAFPYFFVDAPLKIANGSRQDAVDYLKALKAALEAAVVADYATANNKPPPNAPAQKPIPGAVPPPDDAAGDADVDVPMEPMMDDGAPADPAKARRFPVVRQLKMVWGIPYYGYHYEPALYIKVVLFSPSLVKKVSGLLQAGRILGTRFQPYESHIPFLLQVFLDYNLYGMGWLHLRTAKFRLPLPTTAPYTESPHTTASGAALGSTAGCVVMPAATVWLVANVPEEMTHPKRLVSKSGRSSFARHSQTALEIDALTEDILNPLDLTDAQPFSQAQAVPSLMALWQEELERQREAKLGTRQFSAARATFQGFSQPSTFAPPDSFNIEEKLRRQFLQMCAEDTAAPQVPKSRLQDLNDRWQAVQVTHVWTNPRTYAPPPDATDVQVDELLNWLVNASFEETEPIVSQPTTTADPADAPTVESKQEVANDSDDESVADELAMSQQEGQDIVDSQAAVELLLAMARQGQDELAEPELDSENVAPPPLPHQSVSGRSETAAAPVDQNDDDEWSLGPEGNPLLTPPPRRPSEDDADVEAESGDSDDSGSVEATQLFVPSTAPTQPFVPPSPAQDDNGSVSSETSSFADNLFRSPAVVHRQAVIPATQLLAPLPEVEQDLDMFLPPKPKVARGPSPVPSPATAPIPAPAPAPAPSFTLSDEATTQSASLSGLPATQPSSLSHPSMQGNDSSILRFRFAPPSVQDLLSTMDQLGLPEVEHTPVHYGDFHDAQTKPVMFGGVSFKVPCLHTSKLPEFQVVTESGSLRCPWPALRKQVPPWTRVCGTAPMYPPLGLVAAARCAGHGDAKCRRRVLMYRRPAPVLSAASLAEYGVASESKSSGQPSHLLAQAVKFDSNTGRLLPNRKQAKRGRVREAEPKPENLTSQLSLATPSPSKRPAAPPAAVTSPLKQSGTAAGAPSEDGATSAVTSAAKLANQHLTLLSLELLCTTRGVLLPDPKHDPIAAFCYAIHEDVAWTGNSGADYHPTISGIIMVGAFAAGGLQHQRLLGLGSKVHVVCADSEHQLLEHVVDLFRKYDPDVVLGYEVQQSSIGYLLDRAAVLEFPLVQWMSRIPHAPPDRRQGADQWGTDHGSGIWVLGRHVLNLWRLMRSELKLNIYAFETVVQEVLHIRVPRFRSEQLTAWFNGGSVQMGFAVHHVLRRAQLNLALLIELDLIGRTSEMARMIGIDFFSVLTRGSQYRVEAFMLRIAKPRQYILASPSRDQVASQAAMECIPLVMEPQSAVYTSPVVVLDFQSLYPSVMIAYNMCFSTCLGRLSNGGTGNTIAERLGFMAYQPPAGALSASASGFCSPNGVVFAPKSLRGGVLPAMLSDILGTRVMIKSAQKAPYAVDNPVLQRVLHARQFALKMIANVTYGYTSAGFSGRMPCAEIADAIVQTGRAALEAAIQIVESTEKWKAQVVYGDTDSLFVLLPGRSTDQAFVIGKEIADAVTAANPPPMKLKLEKVYAAGVMVSKKRYAGYMMEKPGQTPTLDCKGLELVRRDSCPAVAKMMDKTLRTLFTTRDLSALRVYLQRQWYKMLADRLSAEDFIFAKEVRLGTYSDRGTLPPAAIVSSKMMMKDPRAEPRYGQRVPYLVVYGEPGARLIDLVVTPEHFLANRASLRLNATYYITKQIIPSLNRLLQLAGADASKWFADMKRPQARALRRRLVNKKDDGGAAAVGGFSTLDSYYMQDQCVLCGAVARTAVCDSCMSNPARCYTVAHHKLHVAGTEYQRVMTACRNCSQLGMSGRPVPCVSIHCSILYTRLKRQDQLDQALRACAVLRDMEDTTTS